MIDLHRFAALVITSVILWSCKAPEGLLNQQDSPDKPTPAASQQEPAPIAIPPTPKVCEAPTPEAVFTPKPFVAHMDADCLPDRQECWVSHVLTNGFSWATSNHYYQCYPAVGAGIWLAFYDNQDVYWGSEAGNFFPVGDGLATGNCAFTWRKDRIEYATAPDAILDTVGYLTAIQLPSYNSVTKEWSGALDWFNCSVVQYP